MIKIVKDIDLFNDIGKYDLILIGTNTSYYMRHGFQRKVMLNYPYVYDENLKTKYGDKEKLGTFVVCQKDNQPVFLLCFINDGLNTRTDLKKDYLSYESLEKCIKMINVLYKGKNIATTFIGCSRFDGNGDKDRVMKILENSSDNINLTVYDYEQKSRGEMLKEIREKELEVKKQDINKYYEMVRQRKDKEKKIKELNGHAKK